MKKTILRAVLAAGAMALALMSQAPDRLTGACYRNSKYEQDCQDCCVDTMQDCKKGTNSSASCASFNFQNCVSACKSLSNETGPGEPGSQPQGHNGN